MNQNFLMKGKDLKQKNVGDSSAQVLDNAIESII
jgi:hypothetical protein